MENQSKSVPICVPECDEDLQILERLRIQSTEKIHEIKSKLISRELTITELQQEIEQLREQVARQNAVLSSFKIHIQELEDKEHNLQTSLGKNDIIIQELHQDVKCYKDKNWENEKKINHLERTNTEILQMKERIKSKFEDCTRRLSHALNIECCDSLNHSPEIIIEKVEELVHELKNLRNKFTNAENIISTTETDYRTCMDALDKAIKEKDKYNHKISSQLSDIDQLRQEKERLEIQCKVVEREANDLREKTFSCNRKISNLTSTITTQDVLICQLRDDLRLRDEKIQKIQTELKTLLESLSNLLSDANRYIESTETAIIERIHEILNENQNNNLKIHRLKEQIKSTTDSAHHQSELMESVVSKYRTLEDERAELESKTRKIEADLTSCELSRVTLRQDKTVLLNFLERLGKVMQLDDISHEIGIDLHMEALIVRAEQLARLETEKLADKASVVYQLQRRIRTLREQLQRRDLHLDLLRRKLSLQEDSVRVKTMLQSEKDEANLRIKKLMKQLDRFHIQLAEEKNKNREISAQLTEAADYKISALERSRKIEDLQKRLIESETLRTRLNRKLSMLKEQLRSLSETFNQERSVTDHTLQILRDDFVQAKQALSEITRRESQLQSFRVSVAKIMSEPICTPDCEMISRLQKMVSANRDFTTLSRRYEDTLDTTPSRCTSTHAIHPLRSPCSGYTRYNDSGFADRPDLHDIDDECNKRHIQSSLLP